MNALGSPGAPVWIGGDRLGALLPMAGAIDAVERAIAAGLDPEAGPVRTVLDVPAGQLLLMPAADGRYAGVKLATVAPDNPHRGMPRVQGVYLLLDGETLAPLALLDGIALTAIRTPAVSAVAVRRLTPEQPLRVVVFGAGPQARGHVEAVAAVRRIARLAVVVRDPGSARPYDWAGNETGVEPVLAEPEAVRDADLVLCCTSAAEPVFDGALLPDHAAVIAMGSHEPTAREVDEIVVARSALYVEARAAALREAGDLLLAGARDGDRLTNLAELRAPVDLTRPRLFKSVGMAWEDLVVAAAAYARLGGKGD